MAASRHPIVFAHAASRIAHHASRITHHASRNGNVKNMCPGAQIGLSIPMTTVARERAERLRARRRSALLRASVLLIRVGQPVPMARRDTQLDEVSRWKGGENNGFSNQ